MDGCGCVEKWARERREGKDGIGFTGWTVNAGRLYQEYEMENISPV
jgi:hypothetical protein